MAGDDGKEVEKRSVHDDMALLWLQGLGSTSVLLTESSLGLGAVESFSSSCWDAVAFTLYYHCFAICVHAG